MKFEQDHDACGVGQVVDLEASMVRSLQENKQAAIAGLQRHDILQEGIDELICNHHRIGVLPDGTGDGCGIATDIPIDFYNGVLEKEGLGSEHSYEFGKLAIGQLFLPQDNSLRVNEKSPKEVIEALIKADVRFKFIGFRKVPANNTGLSERAKRTMPDLEQVFFAVKDGVDQQEAERACIEMQGKIDQACAAFNNEQTEEKNRVNVVSMSTDTIAWKGMLRPDQLQGFYSDLGEKDYRASRVLYHGRMSTNSDPQWAYAHPNNKIGHNGEINTIEGNRADRHAFGLEIARDKAMIAAERGSDSRTFAADVAEQFKRDGMPYSQAVAMLLRPAYLNDPSLSDQAKAMLHVFDLERKAYTGPAHIVASTDEEQLAALDPSGLRPSRYALTIKKIPEGEDGAKLAAEMERRKAAYGWPYNLVPEGHMLAKLHIGSEDLWQDKELRKKGEYVLVRGILSAGEMLLHKTDGRFYQGLELIEEMAKEKDWKGELARLTETGAAPDFSDAKPEDHPLDLTSRMNMLLWDEETTKVILDPMIDSGKVSVTAMGDDGELLRQNHPTHMAAYFKQIFAQITNPPLDYIREKESFSLQTNIGKHPLSNGGGTLLTFDKPFLMDNQLQNIRDKLNTVTIDLTYEVGNSADEAIAHYEAALKSVVAQAVEAARNGKVIIVSDCNIGLNKSAISDVDAVASIDKALQRIGAEERTPIRTNTDIIVESGQAKDPHHAAVLFAFGAKAVNSYLVNAYVRQQFARNSNAVKGKKIDDVFANIYKGYEYAYGKTLGRYGISNHENYVGGGLMEANGIDTREKGFGEAFVGTYSPVAGLNRADIALAHFAANQLANEQLQDFAALEEVITKIMQELMGKDAEPSANMRAILQRHYNSLKSTVYLEGEPQQERIAEILKQVVKEDAGKEVEESAFAQRTEHIVDLLERTRPSPEVLKHYGIFSMREGGIAHRLGPQLVRTTNAMFQKLAEKRQIHIDQEKAAHPDMSKKEIEQLEKYAHVPLDEDGCVSKEYLRNLKEPSDAYKIFAETIEQSRIEQPISSRDYITIEPSGRNALSDNEMKINTLDIIQRTTRTGQMSQGALTPLAWRTIVEAENRLHGNPSAGEGGEDPRLLGTIQSPKIKQIASGRFGIHPEMLASAAREGGGIQIKVVQGAKPGEGGEMPGGKVNMQIAILRQSVPGEPLASPAPMHDIYSIEDLTQLIYDLKSIPKTDEHGNIVFDDEGKMQTLDVDVKIGATSSAEIVVRGAAKAGADSITLAGHEGGTGAAPALSARNTGQDWLFDIARIDKGLREDGTRSNVKLVAEGGIITHYDALLALKYADMIGQGTFEMIANRCIMARMCHKAGVSDAQSAAYHERFKQEHGREPMTPDDYIMLVGNGYCPTGVANSEVLFKSEPWRIEQYRMDFAAAMYKHLRDHGYKNLEEWQKDRHFRFKPTNIHGGFDFSILEEPVAEELAFERHEMGESPNNRADDAWLEEVKNYLGAMKAGQADRNDLMINGQSIGQGSASFKPLVIEHDVKPGDRALGARTSGFIALQMSADGRIEMQKYTDRPVLPGGAIHIKAHGNTGQMLGAFNANAQHIEVMGVGQDGVGKSGAGGSIAIAPDIPEDHPCPDVYRANSVLAGNVVGYGNQGTMLFIAGKVGARANVCAHGGTLVCEGLGDYAGEFQTQGTIINLGALGAHACNAMIGGIFMQYDPGRTYQDGIGDARLANQDETALGQPMVKHLLRMHVDKTGSAKAEQILKHWEQEKNNFRIMIPKSMDHFKTAGQFKKLMEQAERQKTALDPGSAYIMQALLDKMTPDQKTALEIGG